ncbi:MAG TPA: trypsin-like peptidase domain-containing protein [Myxococcota bacterium]|nr:trypsin-like peptidase domain-containing protein [Myxococcota bacterium]
MSPMLLFCAAALAADRMTPTVKAVQQAAPSVVAIETEMTVANPFPLWGPSQFETTSQGSGVVIDEAGIVLTNAHVVHGANEITVHTSDGRSHVARLIGMESNLDLAVLSLRVDDPLPTIELGTSSDLMLGEPVIAIGNPYGLGQTVSTGVVSSVSREVEIQTGIVQDYVQTDAAINPGNSGGALVNIEGELIGINTAIHAQAEGIGFAIPVDRAYKVAQDLMLYGKVNVPWLGTDLGDLSRRRLEGTPLEEGAVVVDAVHDDSPAATAGIEHGDLLYKADGRPIHSRADLNAYLSQKDPGEKVSLSLYRGTRPLKVSIVTTAFPEDLVDTVIGTTMGIELEPGGFGLLVSEVDPDGSWADAGLKTGDIILAVNGQAIKKPEDLRAALVDAKSGHRSSATFTIARGNHRGSVTLRI